MFNFVVSPAVLPIVHSVYCACIVGLTLPRRVSIDLLVVVCIAYIIRVLSLAAMGSEFA